MPKYVIQVAFAEDNTFWHGIMKRHREAMVAAVGQALEVPPEQFTLADPILENPDHYVLGVAPARLLIDSPKSCGQKGIAKAISAALKAHIRELNGAVFEVFLGDYYRSN